VLDLNLLNRRMRTRMSGGVGGDWRDELASPYPDPVLADIAAGFDMALRAKLNLNGARPYSSRPSEPARGACRNLVAEANSVGSG